MKRFVSIVCLAACVVASAVRADDWSRIYAVESVVLSADGRDLLFSWCGTNWTAAVTGGVARTVAEIPPAWSSGPFTNETAAAGVVDCRLSPDDRRVACRFRGGSQFRRRRGPCGSTAGEIWLYDGRVATWSRLAPHPNDSRSPAWLADGRIAFLRDDGRGGRDVRTVDPATGSEAVLIAADEDGGELPTFLSASGDGRSLVLRRGLDLWVYRLDDAGRVASRRRVVLHPDPSWKRLPRMRSRRYVDNWNNGSRDRPAVSSNGRDVIFTAGGDLWALDSENPSNNVCRLRGETATHERCPALSPDGMTLYYLRDHGDRAEVWSMSRADPSRPWYVPGSLVNRRIAGGDGLRARLTCSPVGDMIAWTDGDGLWCCSTNAGARARKYSPPGTTIAWEYAWSPDGTRIALVAGDASRNADVWVVSVRDDAPAVNVSDHLLWDGEPQWATNGAALYFRGQWSASGGKRLFKVDLRRPLTTGCGKLVPEKEEKKSLASCGKRAAVTLPKFSVRQTTDLEAYRELGFRTVWANLRRDFCAPGSDRVDWDALRRKYLPAARHAPCWRQFQRVMQQMAGELDSSHQGFFANDDARKEWKLPKNGGKGAARTDGAADAARRRVQEATDGRWGYVKLSTMTQDAYDGFRNDLYREGRGREGIVLDLRGNTGGNRGDLMIACLMTPSHGWGVAKSGAKGYLVDHLRRVQFAGRLIALIDEKVTSNGEMFAQMLQTFGRATLVGRPTAGEVLATHNRTVLDLGTFRLPFFRWYAQSGCELENRGVTPDVRVDDTPADRQQKRDVQLEEAIRLAVR